jgi:hypothetical protein
MTNPNTNTTHPPTRKPQEGVLKVCLDMFFKYEWTSVLHQSITRIVTWIMDAGPSRLELQIYLVKECDILERILQANEYNDRMEQVALVPTAAAGVGVGVGVGGPGESALAGMGMGIGEEAGQGEKAGEGEGGERERERRAPRCRRGYMGHLFIMAQAVMEAARQLTPEMMMDDPLLLQQHLQAQQEEEEAAAAAVGEGNGGSGSGSGSGNGGRSFAQFMETELDAELLGRWTGFIQGRLAAVTATQCQPLGGYAIPSRADENKLSTKFDDEGPGPDFDQVDVRGGGVFVLLPLVVVVVVYFYPWLGEGEHVM